MQVISISDVGKCYDNARVESFFATLKKEIAFINTKVMNMQEGRNSILEYSLTTFIEHQLIKFTTNYLWVKIWKKKISLIY